MVYSLLWVMQDLDHQPYFRRFGSLSQQSGQDQKLDHRAGMDEEDLILSSPGRVYTPSPGFRV